MRRLGLALFVVVVAGGARADSLYDRLWPAAPDADQRTWAEHFERSLGDLGNKLGYHVDLLSRNMIGMRVDSARRRAWIHVGGGNDRYLTLRIHGNLHFTDGVARVTTRLDFTVRGKRLELEMPEVDVAPTSYRGERGVEVRLPLFRRRW